MQKNIYHDLIDRLWKVEDTLRERNPHDQLRAEISDIINVLQGLQKGTAEVYKSDGWRFRLKADNGEIIGSGEGYKNKKDMLDTLKKYYPTFTIKAK